MSLINCIFNTFLMMPSAKQDKSNNTPSPPSKDSLYALTKLNEINSPVYAYSQ